MEEGIVTCQQDWRRAGLGQKTWQVFSCIWQTLKKYQTNSTMRRLEDSRPMRSLGGRAFIGWSWPWLWREDERSVHRNKSATCAGSTRIRADARKESSYIVDSANWSCCAETWTSTRPGRAGKTQEVDHHHENGHTAQILSGYWKWD